MIELLEQLLMFEVYNTSGEVIPPFACMELDYAFDSGRSALEVVEGPSLVLRVKKPTSDNLDTPAMFVFNGSSAIDIDSCGKAMKLPFIQAVMDFATPPEPGDSCGPVDSSWLLSTAGNGFTVKTVDSGLAYENGNTKSVFVEPAGGSSSLKHVYPPSGGIPAATWNATTEQMTPGQAACRIAEKIGGAYTPTAETVMIENPVGAIVGISGKPMTVGRNTSGAWTVLVEDCTGTQTTVAESPPSDPGNGESSNAVDMGYTLGV